MDKDIFLTIDIFVDSYIFLNIEYIIIDLNQIYPMKPLKFEIFSFQSKVMMEKLLKRSVTVGPGGLASPKMVIQFIKFFSPIFLMVLELFKCHRVDLHMTANRSLVHFTHSQ